MVVSLRHHEEVMGTVVSFALDPGAVSAHIAATALESAVSYLHEVDHALSTWQIGSPLNCWRRGEAEAPAMLSPVLVVCTEARRLSAGAFDPWSLPGGCDPTGLVKGWAAAQAAQLLAEAGLRAGMVNAAGDIKVFGQPEPGRNWQAGLTNPWQPQTLLEVISVPSALATSGRYERGNHIIARDGQAACSIMAASVTGPDLALADAFATGLMVDGIDGLSWLETIPGYEARIEDNHRRSYTSSGWSLISAAIAA